MTQSKENIDKEYSFNSMKEEIININCDIQYYNKNDSYSKPISNNNYEYVCSNSQQEDTKYIKNNEINDNTITNIEINDKKTHEFIIKAIKRHGDKYDYSMVKYINAKSKIEIICHEHGLFYQQPSNHLSGQGCPKCSGKNKTTDEFINEAKKIHGNNYDYTDVKYKRCDKNITIKCLKHGKFEQRPSNHLNGKGCPKCGDLVTANKKRKTTDEFISQAIEKHNDKYDYTAVNYEDSNIKIFIKCPNHGLFQQTPAHHLNGQGCPYCAILDNANKKRKHIDKFISQANEIHNNKYNYTAVNYKSMNIKVSIICPKHGEFKQTAGSHLSGNGCPNCGILARTNKQKKTTDEFISQAKKKHGDKYNYEQVNYESSHIKVSIICSNHGKFEQTPASHLSGNGCPKCGDSVTREKLRKTTDVFISEAIYKHNDKYDYANVIYKNSHTDVCIQCPKHGIFLQTPTNHLEGKGCSKCLVVDLKIQ